MFTEIYGYIHSQDTASTTWVVPHALNCSPAVQVFIHYGGKMQRVLPLDIRVNDANTVTITFSNPQTGKVVLQ